MKRELLQKIIDEAELITVENSSTPAFKAWKNLVERTLIKVFGKDSYEFKEFNKLKFFYSPSFMWLGEDYSAEHAASFRRDFDVAKRTIASYTEELAGEHHDSQELEEVTERTVDKVFISHSSEDKEIVEEIIEILEAVGLASTQIFCSSFEGYGINLGEDFLARLRTELDDNVLVLFVLSQNFYQSPICLCEMGASWIKTSQHIPILIPPFDYKDIRGVIPLTQGFKITEPLKLNLFKAKIEDLFKLDSIDNSSWERKRDRVGARINKIIEDSR